jgi:hypothetical protein
VSVVRCQVEVFASGRALVQRDPTECGVSEYDLETSTRMGHRPTKGAGAGAGAKGLIIFNFPANMNTK